MRSDYCVYYHLDSNDVVRYVGSGNLKRSTRSSNRNAEWHKLFDQSPFKVELVKTGLTRTEALKLETTLIGTHSETVVNRKFSADEVKELSYEILSELFEISSNSASGLIWKVKSGRYGRYPAGSVAGSLCGKPNKRYWSVNTKLGILAVHRIVYLLAHQNICSMQVIHHKDGNSTNNNIENLEQVSQSVNVYKTDVKPKGKVLGVSIRTHKGIPSRAVARFCFEPNKETRANFSVKDYGSIEKAFEAACEWRKSAELKFESELEKERNGNITRY